MNLASDSFAAIVTTDDSIEHQSSFGWLRQLQMFNASLYLSQTCLSSSVFVFITLQLQRWSATRRRAAM